MNTLIGDTATWLRSTVGSNSFLGGLLLNQPATIIAAMLFSSPHPPFDVPTSLANPVFRCLLKRNAW